MGHWEQIGEENRIERARQAAMPKWRRQLRRWLGIALIAASWIGVSLVLWLVVWRFLG